MLTYKCAHCASPITVEDSQRVGQCPVCGSIFVFPNQYAVKNNLYRLASEALHARNFDVALTYYSRILKVDAIETAAHWGYLLSKYGIELSTDAKTMHQILFHRLERTPFMEDPSYEKMITYCPADARYYYEGLSRRIAEKQRQLWAIADQVGQYDIYINCVEGPSTADYLLANQVGKALDEAGYRVFLPCTMLGNVPDAEKNLYEMAVAEKAASMMVVVTKHTKMTESRYQAIWKRYLAYRRQDAGRKMLSVYQDIKPEDLPLELQPLQSLECSGVDFQDMVLTEINKMFGRQNRNASVTREILEQLHDGQEHLAEGRFQEAKTCFELVLELDVEDSQAQWGLVCVATENLTKPVISSEFDTLYNRALQLVKGDKKEVYRAAVSKLMTEPAWQALMKITASLERTAISETEEVSQAIDRVYLYMPKGDARLQKIVDYRKMAQMEREAGAIRQGYQNHDVVMQPLFAEQSKAIYEYNSVEIKGARVLEHANGWFAGYVVSYILLMISQLIQVGIYYDQVGLREPEYKTAVCDVLMLAGVVVFLVTFFFMCTRGKEEGRLKAYVQLGLFGGAAVWFVSVFLNHIVHIGVMLFPLLAMVLLVIFVMQDSRMLEGSLNRRKKAGQKLLDIESRIAAAYQQQMKDHYAKYGQEGHAIQPCPMRRNDHVAQDINRSPRTVGGMAFVIKTVVALVAAILIPTVVSNMTYAGGWYDIETIDGYAYHVVGLRSDGTVVANGANYYGQCDVESWQDIVQITTGKDFTVGLKEDGTVVLAGNTYKLDDARNWTDIVQIDAGLYHLLGLKSDGTCVAVGRDEDGALDVGHFEDVIQIHAATGSQGMMSMGITSTGYVYMTDGWGEDADWVRTETGTGEGKMRVTALYGDWGSVLAVSEDGQCRGIGNDLDQQLSRAVEWDGSQIVEAACRQETVALKKDGTVVYSGEEDGREYLLSKWTDIVDMAGYSFHFLGLHEDGTVEAVGLNDDGQCEVEDWKDIEKVFALNYTSYGVKENGSVVAAGFGPAGLTYVSDKNPLEVLQFWLSAAEWESQIDP